MKKYFNAEDMKLDTEAGERVVSDHNTIIHCHHYNSRIQRTIEGADVIDGKGIFRSAAATTFGHQITEALNERKLSDVEEKFQLAQELYSFLGFGLIDFNNLSNQVLTQQSSHFVEGWKSGHKKPQNMVCTFTEGYLEGALAAVTGQAYKVRETACMALGAEECSFSVETAESLPNLNYRKNPTPKVDLSSIRSGHPELKTKFDMEGITNTVFGMPLFGNDAGIIPAFNVYLAHMPRDFYNLVCHQYIAKMSELGMRDVARGLLIEDAENCGLNTFSGIMNSEEWAALIQPMIEKTEDNLFGLIAVANALGWGKTEIVSHKPYEQLEFRTANGYESIGGIQIFGQSGHEECVMLSGVAAGMMALIYGSGDFSRRSGVFNTKETKCFSSGDDHCAFTTSLASEKKEGTAA